MFAAVLLLTTVLPLDFRGFLWAVLTAAAMLALLELGQLFRGVAGARWPLVAFTALMLGLSGLAVASSAPPPPAGCHAQAGAPAVAQTPPAAPCPTP